MNSNEDYYVDETGNVVFTEKYLRSRGRCCKCGCKHCPWKPKKKKQKET